MAPAYRVHFATMAVALLALAVAITALVLAAKVTKDVKQLRDAVLAEVQAAAAQAAQNDIE